MARTYGRRPVFFSGPTVWLSLLARGCVGYGGAAIATETLIPKLQEAVYYWIQQAKEEAKVYGWARDYFNDDPTFFR